MSINPIFKRFYLFILAVAVAAVVSFSSQGCQKASQAGTTADSTKQTTAMATGVSAEHGKYLVMAMGCNDCHTPLKMGPQGPEPDMSRMLSGHPSDAKVSEGFKTAGLKQPFMWGGDATNTAFYGPWGISYTMNLTPDSLTGIGSWSEKTFMDAIRTGKHMGVGRPIMPPMPWQFFKNLNDDDLKSIYAFLRTIPVIHNEVPAYEPPAGAAPTSGKPAEAPKAGKS